MIEPLRISRKFNYDALLSFINSEMDYDFYYTRDNERFFVNDKKTLKSLLRESCFVITQQELGDYVGFALLWKSDGGGKTRYYLKMRAKNKKYARDLITAMLWQTNKEIFVKIRKDSKYMEPLRAKGFRFCGSRGIQVLLTKEVRKALPHGSYAGKSGDFDTESD